MIAHLPGRAVLSVTGADRVAFLNGLVSNDVEDTAPGRAVWAALLSPQGKWLADFFVLAEPGRLLLDCEAEAAGMLVQRLSRYRLRADVLIAPTDLQVFAAWGGAPDEAASWTPDPRLPDAGWRAVSAGMLQANAGFEGWDAHRLALGLPDGSRDLEADKTVLLEAGFDELHGVSWTKGCYMGQELTARTRYRGLVKRRLLRVSGADLPPPGTVVLCGDRQAGQMRSSRDGAGLAVLRLDAIGAGALTADGRPLTVIIPDWTKLPETA